MRRVEVQEEALVRLLRSPRGLLWSANRNEGEEINGSTAKSLEAQGYVDVEDFRGKVTLTPRGRTFAEALAKEMVS